MIVKISLKDNRQNDGDHDNSNEEKDISNNNNVKNNCLNLILNNKNVDTKKIIWMLFIKIKYK